MRSRNPTPAHQLHPFAGRAWRDLARFVGEALAAGLITSLVLALATFIVSTHAAAAPGARDDAPRGGLLLRSAPDAPPVPAPLLATDVRISVSGIVARATVRQRFHNPTAVWQEGVYVFPLPENAAVDHLEMRTGERVIEGVIRERAAARAEYEQAKAEGRKASLIEEQRPNVFTTRVAHLGPGEDIDITLEYQQTLRFDAGTFRLRFPMVVAPRYIPGSVVAAATAGTGWAEATDEVPDAAEITPPVVPPAMGRINPVTLAVDLNPGFALARLESPTHAITVGETADGRHRVELASAVVAASRDFELAWTPDVGSAPGAALFTEVRDGGVYALLMVNPPQAESGTPRAPREVVFVIDTSGSMEGTSIVQAREALQLALERLQPGDRFDVIEFNSSARALFGSPLPAEPATVARARAFVAGLKARGGTEMRAALELALKPGRSPGFVRQVVFLTDGAVGNESALFTLIRDRLGDRRLFTVGIGSAPNSHFMTKAAQFGRGSFTYHRRRPRSRAEDGRTPAQAGEPGADRHRDHLAGPRRRLSRRRCPTSTSASRSSSAQRWSRPTARSCCAAGATGSRGRRGCRWPSTRPRPESASSGRGPGSRRCRTGCTRALRRAKFARRSSTSRSPITSSASTRAWSPST